MEKPLTILEAQERHIPESLERVILGIEENVGSTSRNQLIAGLFYVLMQECGYELKQTVECDSDLKSSVNLEGNERKTMTFNLKRLLSQASLVIPLLAAPIGPYKIPMQLVGIENYRFHLLVSPSAEDLIVVNLLVAKQDFRECFSLALRVSTFVPKPKAENIGERFFDLQTLSLIFKDNIAHKGRSVVLNTEGIVNNSLLGLMDEVKQRIAERLPIVDLLNLTATCRSLLSIKLDVCTWKTLLKRDFNYTVTEHDVASLEDLIKKYKFLEKQKRDRQTDPVHSWLRWSAF